MADEKKKETSPTGPLNPLAPKLSLWNFSHNNCEEIHVEAADEKGAIKAGLKRIGLIESPHPCRAWPVKE